MHKMSFSIKGKSTIVSAITLGLGGDKSTLGRQKHYSEFINNARDEDAQIEIELENSRGDNHIIGSRITKAGGKNGSVR